MSVDLQRQCLSGAQETDIYIKHNVQQVSKYLTISTRPSNTQDMIIVQIIHKHSLYTTSHGPRVKGET